MEEQVEERGRRQAKSCLTELIHMCAHTHTHTHTHTVHTCIVHKRRGSGGVGGTLLLGDKKRKGEPVVVKCMWKHSFLCHLYGLYTLLFQLEVLPK